MKYRVSNIEMLFLKWLIFSETDVIATGGKGDREIFIYKASNLGKLTKQHCLRGHTGTGWLRRIWTNLLSVYLISLSRFDLASLYLPTKVESPLKI